MNNTDENIYKKIVEENKILLEKNKILNNKLDKLSKKNLSLVTELEEFKNKDKDNKLKIMNNMIDNIKVNENLNNLDLNIKKVNLEFNKLKKELIDNISMIKNLDVNLNNNILDLYNRINICDINNKKNLDYINKVYNNKDNNINLNKDEIQFCNDAQIIMPKNWWCKSGHKIMYKRGIFYCEKKGNYDLKTHKSHNCFPIISYDNKNLLFKPSIYCETAKYAFKQLASELKHKFPTIDMFVLFKIYKPSILNHNLLNHVFGNNSGFYKLANITFEWQIIPLNCLLIDIPKLKNYIHKLQNFQDTHIYFFKLATDITDYPKFFTQFIECELYKK